MAKYQLLTYSTLPVYPEYPLLSPFYLLWIITTPGMVLHGVALWHSNHSNTHFYDLIQLCGGLNRPKCQIICSRRQSFLNAAGGGAGWFFNVFPGTPKKRSVKDTSGLPSLKNDVVEQKTWPLRENCAALGGETDDNHQQSPGSQWTRNSLLGSQNDNNSKFIFCSPSWPPGYRVWCDLVLERPFSTSSQGSFVPITIFYCYILHTIILLPSI